jgi:hypothetical protein
MRDEYSLVAVDGVKEVVAADVMGRAGGQTAQEIQLGARRQRMEKQWKYSLWSQDRASNGSKLGPGVAHGGVQRLRVLEEGTIEGRSVHIGCGRVVVRGQMHRGLEGGFSAERHFQSWRLVR